MEEIKEKILLKILADDTRWDLMTGRELLKRITAYKASEGDNEKFIYLLSCLRLANVYYLYSKDDGKTTVPTIPLPEGQVLALFTSKKKIIADSFKRFKVDSARLPELLECFDCADDIGFVCINPNSDDVILPLSNIMEFFKTADDVINGIDEMMEEGISGEVLGDIAFERFSGRRIDCITNTGKHIVGDAYSFGRARGGATYLIVETEEDNKFVLYKSEVETIKDITLYEE